MTKRPSIYTLKLKSGKYYVGKIRGSVKERYQQHVDGKGAKWTRKYPPVAIFDIRKNMKDRDENKVTFEMMKRFGIDNVRGGSYCQVRLSRDKRIYLNAKITGRKARTKPPKYGYRGERRSRQFTKRAPDELRAVFLPQGYPPENLCRAMKKDGWGRCQKSSTDNDGLCDMHRRSTNSKAWSVISREGLAMLSKLIYSAEVDPWPLRGWSKADEPYLTDEHIACLEGIIEGWAELDEYAEELFEDWPDGWRTKWLNHPYSD